MRNIYVKSSLRTELTQGSIICNCIAADYPDCDVYGLIITPRCDMSHGIKVSTVHYLPVISYKDWLSKEFTKIHEQRIIKDLKGKINQWGKETLGIIDFMDNAMYSTDNLISIVTDKKIPKHVKEAVDILTDTSGTLLTEKLSKDKSFRNRIHDELYSGELHGFYLIEHWDTNQGNMNDKFLVVILREVHQITKNIAQKFKKGFFKEELTEEDIKNNSIKICLDPYERIAEIASPFIEHILQGFAYNFSRIGVEDLDKQSWESAYNN